LTSISTSRLAPILEEGFTEYFTRMIMQEQASTLGTPGTAYQAQYEAARLIISNMNPPSAAEAAYFQGNAADIRKVRDGIQFVLQHPDAARLQFIFQGPNTRRVLEGGGMGEIEQALENVRPSARPTRPRDERQRPRGPQDIRER
jgi:hypothetical protein